MSEGLPGDICLTSEQCATSRTSGLDATPLQRLKKENYRGRPHHQDLNGLKPTGSATLQRIWLHTDPQGVIGTRPPHKIPSTAEARTIYGIHYQCLSHLGR